MSSIKQLKSMGAFVSDQPVKREIKFKLDDDNEMTAEIHVKRLSIGDHEKIFLATQDEKNRMAKLIAEAISLGDQGQEKITLTDAYRLHPGIAGAMIDAFNDVNGAKLKN